MDGACSGELNYAAVVSGYNSNDFQDLFFIFQWSMDSGISCVTCQWRYIFISMVKDLKSWMHVYYFCFQGQHYRFSTNPAKWLVGTIIIHQEWLWLGLVTTRAALTRNRVVLMNGIQCKTYSPYGLTHPRCLLTSA